MDEIKAPVAIQPVNQSIALEIEKEETKQLEAGAIEAEKTRDGFKIKFKWWTVIILAVVGTACAITLKKFGVI